MPTLRSKIIKLAHTHPELRKELLPILTEKTAAYNPTELLRVAKAVAALNLHTAASSEDVEALSRMFEVMGSLMYILNQGKLKGKLTQLILRNRVISDNLYEIWGEMFMPGEVTDGSAI